MAKSTSLLEKAYMVDATVELPLGGGTVTGPTVGAGTMVIAAGVELIDAVGSADYDVAVGAGSLTFMATTAVDSDTAGTFVAGTQTPGVIAAEDTIDVVATAGADASADITARVFAIVVNVGDASRTADEVDRDQLA
jgi:hypothetical protein